MWKFNNQFWVCGMVAACFMEPAKFKSNLQYQLVSQFYVWRSFYRRNWFSTTLGLGSVFLLTAWGSTDLMSSSGEGLRLRGDGYLWHGRIRSTFSVASLWWGGQGARKYFNLKSTSNITLGRLLLIAVESSFISQQYCVAEFGKDDKGRPGYSSYV